MAKKDNFFSEYTATNDVLDIDFLKERGVSFIQEMSGNKWTDFNLHDPGLTILEIICLAINELGYRSDHEIHELIRVDTEKIDSFVESSDITTISPYTNNDICKYLLKTDGVINVYMHIDPLMYEFKGVYNIFVEASKQDNKFRKKIKENLLQRLNSIRGFSIDYNQIIFLDLDPIGIDLSIELTETIEVSKFLFNLAEKLNDSFSIDYLDKGRQMYLYISDVISAVMDLKSVAEIEHINFKDTEGNIYNWRYNVASGHIPKVDYAISNITITYKNKTYLSTSLRDYAYNKLEVVSLPQSSDDSNKDSRVIDFSTYTSILNDFPKNFGIGSYGLGQNADNRTKSSSKQLSGYMFLFDQLLSNSFSQLNYLNHLFSFSDVRATKSISFINDFPSLFRIYKPFIDEYFLKKFHVNDDGEIKKAWNSYLESNHDLILKQIQITLENKQQFLKSRNEILTHLLARFGFDIRIFEKVCLLNKDELITYKLDILRNIDSLSKERALGAGARIDSIYKQFGLKRYLYLLLGFRHNCSTSLTEPFTLQNNTPNLSISFPYNRSEAISRLLRHAIDKKNFKKENDKQYKLRIDSAGNFATIKTEESFNLDTIINYLSSLSIQSEGLYILEHLRLRPDDSYRVFSFDVILNDDSVFSSSYLNRKERDKLASLFWNNKTNKEEFSIIERQSKQFAVKWTNSGAELVSNKFFKSDVEATEFLNYLIDNFKVISSEGDLLQYTTKYSNIYNETTDPFSNISTILLPNWPNRFQNNAFKKYIEEIILKEMPAHVYSYIKWLSFDEMQEFEMIYQKYSDSLSVKSLKDKETSLETLLLNLISPVRHG